MPRLLALALVVLCAVPASAQVHPPDTISLWFDPDYTINTMETPIATPFPGYLVLHEPSAEAVAALVFEFHVDSPLVYVLASEWDGDPVVLVEDGCVTAAYSTPRPAAPAMLLDTITFLATGPGPSFFTVEPCEGEACPLYRTAGGEQRCLASIFPDGVVACLDCVIPTAAASWSAVKGLYR